MHYSTISSPQMMRSTQSIQQMNEWKFFHYSLYDDNFYLVTCNILQGFDKHDHDHEFFYQHPNGYHYHVACKLLSRSLIVNILNIMNTNVDDLKQQPLSYNQKFNLEQGLKRILPFHFTQPNHIPNNGETNPFHGCDNIMTTQAVSTTSANNQNNFDNYLPHQTGIGGYDHNVTRPQQQIDFNNNAPAPQYIHEREIGTGYANSFHENIGNNISTASTTDSQTNFNNGYFTQNGVDVSPQQQQVDFDDSPNYNVNTNSSSVENSAMTTQAFSTTDNNGLLCDNRQDVNGISDYSPIGYPPQQINLPPYHISEGPDYNANGKY